LRFPNLFRPLDGDRCHTPRPADRKRFPFAISEPFSSARLLARFHSRHLGSVLRCPILAADPAVDLVPDALTSALHELGLRCSYPRAETLSGDWRLPFPRDTISLHVLLRGRCSIETDIPLWNRRLDLSDVLVVNRDVGGALIPAGSMAGPTEVLSVGIHLEGPVGHPLLVAIPPLIAARIDRVPLPASFEPAVVALQSEISRPSGGHPLVLMDLSRVLFVQALRIHMLDLSWDDRGYFRALVDPILRDSLLAASQPSRAGASVAELASKAERSSGRFRVRFRQFAGQAPGSFVKEVRVRRAAELLRKGCTSLDQVASESGFASRQGLCRAFRRELGTTPAAYRRRFHGRRLPRSRSCPPRTERTRHSGAFEPPS
jgi:AraC-like DNA-binding protein